MNSVRERNPRLRIIGNVPDDFGALDPFRKAHRILLENRRCRRDDPGFWQEVVSFIRRGQETGKLLGSSDERRAGQSLLDYWTNALHRAGQGSLDASLAEFDLALARERARSPGVFYSGLALEEQKTVEYILMQMVRPGVGETIKYRSIRRERLYRPGGSNEWIDRMLDKLARAGLVRPSRCGVSVEPWIEAVRERVPHLQPMLAEWLEKERRRRLTEAAERWEDVGLDPGALLRGVLLNEALEYENLDELDAKFVRESVAAGIMENQGWIDLEATAQLVRILVALLADQNRDMRVNVDFALESLVKRAPQIASRVSEGLVGLLSGPVSAVRARAARVSERVISANPRTATSHMAEALIGILSDQDYEAFSVAKNTLRRMIALRPDLVPQIATLLEKMLNAPIGVLRAEAAKVLGSAMQENSKVATLQMAETLVGMLNDQDQEVLAATEYTLHRMVALRPDLASQMASILEGMLNAPSGALRARAARTLGAVVQANSRVATQQMANVLLGLLSDQDPQVHSPARYALERVAEANAQVVIFAN